jgi:polar amino acid transport system substrate-binding protein
MCLTLPSAAQADPPVTLTAITGDGNYPYNFIENGQVKGIGYEVLRELARRTGFGFTISILPWKRAQLTAIAQPSAVIFSVARTKGREASYHWIGPIASREIWLYKLSARQDVVVTSLAEARKYRVGDTVSNGSIEALTAQGFTVDEAPSDVYNCKKLQAGRTDLLPLNPVVMEYFAKSCGLTPGDLTPTVMLIRDQGYFLAFSKATDPAILTRLDSQFAAMKADQFMTRVLADWGVK